MNEVERSHYIEPSDLPGNSKKDRSRPWFRQFPGLHPNWSEWSKGKLSRKSGLFWIGSLGLFFGDDAKGVGRYVVFDVLIPAAKIHKRNGKYRH